MDMDQVSLTGDAIAAVVLGCVGTGQGLGDELGEVDERSLNWRAEPASPRKAGVYREASDEALGCFSRKNANRAGARGPSGGPLWEVGERRLNVRAVLRTSLDEPSVRGMRSAAIGCSRWPELCRLACLRMLVLVVRVSAAGGLQAGSCTAYTTHGRHMACTCIHPYTHT